MTILILSAALTGLLAAFALRFVPFACALLLAAAVGIAWRIGHGHGFGETLWPCLILLVVTQLAYGVGLVGAPAARNLVRSLRRAGPIRPDPAPRHTLHTDLGSDR